jgi:hypothetical protein
MRQLNGGMCSFSTFAKHTNHNNLAIFENIANLKIWCKKITDKNPRRGKQWLTPRSSVSYRFATSTIIAFTAILTTSSKNIKIIFKFLLTKNSRRGERPRSPAFHKFTILIVDLNFKLVYMG